MAGTMRLRLRLLLAVVLALAAPRLADAQTPATTYYACVVSRPVVTVGTPVIMILTPAGGPWPPGVTFTPVATGLQGAFLPASAVGASSALVAFLFTPSAPGNGTVSAANSMGMIEASPPTLALQPACLAARQLVGGTPT